MPSVLRMRSIAFILCATSLASCSQTYGPKGLSKPAYEATVRAVNALDRAREYRGASALLFEPRYLDAERAIGELKSTEPIQHGAVGLKAEGCLLAMKLGRLEAEELADSVNANEPKKKQDAAMEQVRKAETDLEACVAEVRGYLF
jgi:hypothetical protein